MQAHGLPTDLTSFVGRETELAGAAELVARSRLVTLTGAGGSGKTRLALELVRTGRAGYRPAHWAELAPLRDPRMVAPTVAEALGISEEGAPIDVATLARLVGHHEALVVLDNCEHLVDACAELADQLLRECPGVSILATSREALGVPGERAWLVPPLGLPPRGDDADPVASEAVRLFVERARDVVADFALTPSTTPAVAEICRRLDGIPLAIELAAARVRVLQPGEILARLEDVFRLLGSGARTSVPRHRTLWAAIDWSHELLDAPSRALLRRLSVFRGGFTLEAAESVGPGDGIDEADVLDLVARLADRSMLVMREHHGFARHHLLEAVRQYAARKLQESGEEHDTRARLARYVLRLVEEAEPHFTRRERRARVERLQDEIYELRASLAWSREHDPSLHVRLVGKLWWFWFSTHHWTEGGRWIEGALGLPAAADAGPDRAALLFAAGALAALQVRPADARPLLEEAVELARAGGDRRLAAYALNYLGLTYAGDGRVEADRLCREAETWFRADGDLYGLRLALLLRGSAAMGQGRLEEAERLNREGVEVARRFGQDRELAISLQNLAAVHLTQGRLDEAEARVREALAASHRDPSAYFVATGVGYLGEIEGMRGRALAAARLLGAADGLRELVGASSFGLDARRVEALLPRLREQIGEGAFERARAEGRALTSEQILDELVGAPGGNGAERPATTSPATSEDGRGASVRERPSAADPDLSPASPVARARPASPSDDPDRAGPSVDPEPPTPLRVDALGPLVVHVEGRPIEAERWPYGKPRELLVFLLLHPGGATRDQIGEALWPGAERSNVKNSFHVTLHHLRKTLEHPEWVVLEGDRYRLAPGLRYRFDADAFATAARKLVGAGAPEGAGRRGASEDHAGGHGTDRDALRDVLDTYRGELFEGEVAGRWIDDHRDRLRRLYVDLNLALGDALEATDPVAASELYRRLAALDGLNEEVHRRLMTALTRAGDRVRALRHFDRLVETLRHELDAEPEPGTLALAEEIRAGG